MPNFMDLTGQRFGRLLVIDRGPDCAKKTRWNCVCDCGRAKLVHATSLKSGETQSCGCYQKECASRANSKGLHDIVHKREYKSWVHMNSRCFTKTNEKYKDYGGRGITVCDRWRHDFAAFFSDMGSCSRGFTLGRIDNDGPYAPENCRWETYSQQARNTRSNKWILAFGLKRLQRDWANYLGMSDANLHYRLKTGRTVEQLSSVLIT